MKKIYLIVALLTGCAGWNDPPPPPRQLTPEQIVIRDKARADIATCKYEAAKATGSSQRGYSLYSVMFNDVGDTFREVELYELCLKAKGYGSKS